MDEAWVGRVVAELPAEARDVDVERLGRAEPVRVPDLVDEALARDDRAGLAHEEVEELELLAGEVEVFTVQARLSPGAVHPDGADVERGAAAGRGGGAELEADDAVGLLAPRREHDDRDVGALAELSGDVVARAVREHDVEEDEV